MICSLGYSFYKKSPQEMAVEPSSRGLSALCCCSDGNLHLVSERECYARCVADRRTVDRCIPERFRELRNNRVALQQRIEKEVNGMSLCFPAGALSLNGSNPRGGVLVPLGQTVVSLLIVRLVERHAGIL